MKIKLIFCLGLLLFPPSAFAEFEDLIESLEGVEIIVAPGLLPKEEILATMGMPDPYARVVGLFREMGLRARKSKLWPGGSIAETSRTLAKEVSDSPLPVFVIGHSLGGNRALHFLLESDAKENTVAAMFKQSPLHGSLGCTFAHFATGMQSLFLNTARVGIDATQSIHEICHAFLGPVGLFIDPLGFRRAPYALARLGDDLQRQATPQALGIDPTVFDEASWQTASGYLDRNRRKISQLAMELPLLSVTASGPSLMFCVPQIALASLGHPSDGVIEQGSQDLRFGVTEEINSDHMDLILRPFENRYTWARLLRRVTNDRLYRERLTRMKNSQSSFPIIDRP